MLVTVALVALASCYAHEDDPCVPAFPDEEGEDTVEIDYTHRIRCHNNDPNR